MNGARKTKMEKTLLGSVALFSLTLLFVAKDVVGLQFDDTTYDRDNEMALEMEKKKTDENVVHFECGLGYTWTKDLRGCSDINECTDGVHGCPVNKKCYNLPGSFMCGNHILTKGAINEAIKADKLNSSSCPDNYTLSNSVCVDIDECATGNYNCNGLDCFNIPNGYECGFLEVHIDLPWTALNDNSSSIINTTSNTLAAIKLDIDDPMIINPSTVTKPYCQPGAMFDDTLKMCTKACKSDTDCHPDLHYCDVELGKCKYRCGSGYEFDEHARNCIDVDECKLDRHFCSPGYYCRNTKGSFRCLKEISAVEEKL